MNIILSRKGFDSKYGKYPNQIIDKQMIPLPIPAKEELSSANSTYSKLFYEKGKSFASLLDSLGCTPKVKDVPTSFCHADPDLNYVTYSDRSKDWRGLFGQCDGAERFLRNGVSSGDVFLFFGTFQKNSVEKPLHYIYGYLQIERRIVLPKEPVDGWMEYHPHIAANFKKNHEINSLYIAKKNLNDDFGNSKFGWGTFCFDEKSEEKLRLSAKDATKSIWDLENLSPHFKEHQILKSIPNDHWCNRSAGRYYSGGMGQEFVIKDINDGLKEWLKSVLALPTFGQKPA